MTTPSTIIKPTIGRKVWFWPNGTHIGVPAAAQPQHQDPRQAMDATIVLVHSERCVNLLVVDHAGATWSVSSVFLQQEGDATPGGMYAQWMPYQAGQAKKEAQIAGYETVLNRAIDAASKRVEQANRFEKVFVSGIQREGPEIRCADLGVNEVQVIPARLTPADIETSIASESYFTAADGVRGAPGGGDPVLTEYVTHPGGPLSLLTFCVLVLRNGAKVVGFNYGSIDPAQHDREMGRSEAKAMALEKVWELEGYLLREHLQRPAGVLTSA